MLGPRKKCIFAIETPIKTIQCNNDATLRFFANSKARRLIVERYVCNLHAHHARIETNRDALSAGCTMQIESV